MRTVAKPKSSKNGLKKRFPVESPEIGSQNGSIFEGTEAAKPSIKGISNDEKYQLIAEAAYFRSEKRSFVPGCELDDWLAAEAEIETRFSETSLSLGSQSNADKRLRRR